MYRLLEVTNFRGFAHLELTGFGRVNLITGLNDVGKSSLLEALLLAASGPTSANVALGILQARGAAPISSGSSVDAASVWDAYFPALDNSQVLQLRAATDVGPINVRWKVSERGSEVQLPIVEPPLIQPGGLRLQLQLPGLSAIGNQPTRNLEIDTEGPEGAQHYIAELTSRGGIQITPQPPLPPIRCGLIASSHRIGPPALAQSFAALQKTRREALLIDALRVVDDDIEHVEVVVEGSVGVPWARMTGDRFIPLSLLGDGVLRVAQVAMSLIDIAPGVLLIDEFENGLHYSVLEDLWKNVGQLARFHDVQVFATTHSRECVGAAAAALNSSDDLVLYRLERNKGGQIASYRYGHQDIEAAFALNVEVR